MIDDTGPGDELDLFARLHEALVFGTDGMCVAIHWQRQAFCINWRLQE